jgi:hypothetical protein
VLDGLGPNLPDGGVGLWDAAYTFTKTVSSAAMVVLVGKQLRSFTQF